MSKSSRAFALSKVFTLIALRESKLILFSKFIKHITINHWFGELGNNLIQIANAYFLSQKLNIPLSIPQHSFLLIQSRFPICADTPTPPIKYFSTSQLLLNELQNLEGYLKPVNQFSRSFFYEFDTLPLKLRLSDYRSILKMLSVDLIPSHPDPSTCNEKLVIHIRSGDAFVSYGAHMAYVQPPLSFYQTVIEMSGCSEVVVVTQSDLRNPCIEGLQKIMPNIRVQTGSLAEDVATILSAKHLITGMSSFSLSLAFCSTHLQNLYIPRLEVQKNYWRVRLWPPLLKMVCQSTHLDLQGLDFKVHPIQINNYISIGNWRNSPQQQALLLQHDRNHLKVESSAQS